MSTATVSHPAPQIKHQAHGPDYLCSMCGKPMSRCSCAGRQLPSGRIELVQHSDGWHWCHVGKRGTCRNTSTDVYATKMAAALAAADIARILGLKLYTGDDSLNQSLVMHWQIEGIEAAKAGKPARVNWNGYQKQGYESVINPSFGWGQGA